VKPVSVVFWREDSHWVARALPVEVSSFGETLDVARARIREALALYFEDEPSPPEIEEALLEEVLV
jgi:predicted RNase H-like HicB family nuclease